MGNMSEAALVVAAAKAGMWDMGTPVIGTPKENVRSTYPAVDSLEVPFSSKRKMKITVHSIEGNTFMGIKFPEGTTHLAVIKVIQEGTIWILWL